MLQEGTNRHFAWDHADQLRAFFDQAGTSEPSVYAQYLYDAGGNRVKKIVRNSSGNEEVTVYLDGLLDYLYEIDNTSSRTEEFNDLHVMDDRKRIAVKSVYASNFTGSTSDPVRYNLEDHLGNACFTFNAAGELISQEEYYPFGESSFQDFTYKRYRFVGKERDEESGLYYYGMRYYAPWKLRFISVDPLALEYPWYTPYQYAGNKPIIAIDLDGAEEDNKIEPTESINLVIIFNPGKSAFEVKGYQYKGNENWTVMTAENMSDADWQVKLKYSNKSINNLLIVSHGGYRPGKGGFLGDADISQYGIEKISNPSGANSYEGVSEEVFYEMKQEKINNNRAATSLFQKVEKSGNIIFKGCKLVSPDHLDSTWAEEIFNLIQDKKGNGPTIYMSMDSVSLENRIYHSNPPPDTFPLPPTKPFSLNVPELALWDQGNTMGKRPLTLSKYNDINHGWISFGKEGLKRLGDRETGVFPAIFGTGAPVRRIPANPWQINLEK